jgi:hypothetical protein
LAAGAALAAAAALAGFAAFEAVLEAAFAMVIS